MKKLSTNATSENVQESTKAPVVIKQKDDVVYISDPKADWRYWGALKVGDKGTPAITISLQKDQAIALLLKKSNAQGTDNINAEGSSKVKAHFGVINNFLGEQLNETTQPGTEYQVDFSETLRKTKMVQRSLV